MPTEGEVQLPKIGADLQIDLHNCLGNFSEGRSGPLPPGLVILRDSASPLRELPRVGFSIAR